MTKREAAIVTAYTGVLVGDFSDFHEYAEEVVGRPIFTHELANKEVWVEVKKKSRPDFIELGVV